MARGELAYVDEPLYDYVQHHDAVIGHSMANKKPRPIRQHLVERLRNPTGGSRIVYFYDWHQQLLFAEVVRLRCWDRMAPGKRRVVRRLLVGRQRRGGARLAPWPPCAAALGPRRDAGSGALLFLRAGQAAGGLGLHRRPETSEPLPAA